MNDAEARTSMEPEQARAALFVDFDNVFSSLHTLRRTAALAFASKPERWLRWIAEGGDGGGRRRLLVRRCYMNPIGLVLPVAGGASANGEASLVRFGRHRGAMVRNGVQVVDCPHLNRSKNAADIVMALDVVDALAHPTRFDEFVLLSGDADFTPLLHRLRAHDRRSTVLAPPQMAAAFQASADRVLSLNAFASEGCLDRPPVQAEAAPPTDAPDPAPLIPDPGDRADQRATLLAVVRRQLDEADAALRLGDIGIALSASCSPWVKNSSYGGAGTLSKLVQAGEGWVYRPGQSGGWLFDPERHEPPPQHEG